MRLILSSILLLSSLGASAQNLITNAGAESATVGSGWTIFSGPGNSGCTATATNWRSLGSAISTTPHSGSYVFYPGCNTTTGGTYEIYQDVNVAADATSIDAGAGTYTFAGWYSNYNQASPDQSRFIIEFRNGSTTVLSNYNSGILTTATNTSASQGPWVRLVNTATVPVGTRVIRVRLQAIHNSGSAIDSYFDDISLVRGANPLPLSLTDFTARVVTEGVSLNWKDRVAQSNIGYNVYWSTDGASWKEVGYTPVLDGSDKENSYTFLHGTPAKGNNYYRIASIAKGGNLDYSHVINTKVSSAKNVEFIMSPNPATGELSIALNNSQRPAVATITSIQGTTVLRLNLNNGINKISLNGVPSGNYIVSLTIGDVVERKLLIVNQ